MEKDSLNYIYMELSEDNSENKLSPNEILDINRFSFAVHLFSLVTTLTNSVIMSSWELITSNGKYDKISKTSTLTIFKHKKFFIKQLISVFNSAWLNPSNSIIENHRINSLMKYGSYLHEYCCFVEAFEITKEILSTTLDIFKLSDIGNPKDLLKSCSNYVDKLLADQYEILTKSRLQQCYCIKYQHMQIRLRTEPLIYEKNA